MAKVTNAELLRCVAQLGDDQRECIVLCGSSRACPSRRPRR